MDSIPAELPIPEGQSAYDERRAYRASDPLSQEVLPIFERMRPVDHYDASRDHDQSPEALR